MTNGGFTFSIDRVGLELEGGRNVEVAFDYAELGLDPDGAPAELGRKLSALCGTVVEDEEGLFDLAVRRGEELVATLAVACEDDGVEVVGEQLPSVDQGELIAALRAAL